MKKHFAAAAAVIFACGCHSKPAPEVSAPQSPSPVVRVQTPPAEPPKPDTSTLPPAAPIPESNNATADSSSTPGAKSPADAIPDDLKSPAYEYYGLGTSKPIDYEVTGDETAGIRTGTLTTSLKEVKDGKAYFTQVHSGGLYLLGNDEVSLDAEGVHVTSSTVEAPDPNNLEFPAVVTPGKSWKSHDKISQEGLTFEVNSVSTIKGPATIDTKRGPLQALRITSVSQAIKNGQKLTMDSDTYYVKGIGLAKATIRTIPEKGKISTIVQQLAD
jgi:hypothetical protein